jgi:hypothetical protein
MFALASSVLFQPGDDKIPTSPGLKTSTVSCGLRVGTA